MLINRNNGRCNGEWPRLINAPSSSNHSQIKKTRNSNDEIVVCWNQRAFSFYCSMHLARALLHFESDKNKHNRGEHVNWTLDHNVDDGSGRFEANLRSITFWNCLLLRKAVNVDPKCVYACPWFIAPTENFSLNSCTAKIYEFSNRFFSTS